MQMAIVPIIPGRGWFGGVFWRVRQFGHAIWSRSDPGVDEELQRLLASDGQWQLLARLTPFDRAHHLRVHRLLVDAGYTDQDLLRAALLHDVGKADGLGRVNAAHRVVHVLLDHLSPAVMNRLAREGRWFRHGLWLSVRHAEIGAAHARATGASERCCWLIARHGDESAGDDASLAALMIADHAAIR